MNGNNYINKGKIVFKSYVVCLLFGFLLVEEIFTIIICFISWDYKSEDVFIYNHIYIYIGNGE